MTVHEMVKVCQKPLKRHTDTVARRLVKKFPSLTDTNLENDTVLGTGFESLAVQLKYRVENVNRTPGKEIDTEVSPEDGEEPVSKKKKSSYGCVNHNPTDIPDGETLESLLEKKVELVRKFGEGERSWQMDDINDLMDLTFYLQRKDINKCKTVLDFQPTWPFLFQESGLLIHFRKLMAVDLDSASTEPKVVKLLSYLKTQNVSKYPVQFRNAATHVLEDLAKIDDASRDVRLSASVLLLMAFFKEDSESLFVEADVRS